MWHYGIWIQFCWCGPLHLAFSGDVAYACTNIQQEAAEAEEEEDTPHIDTWRNVRVWVDFFDGCINDKICDIREIDVTIKSEMWTTNIRSLGFGDIR